ncbi:MAG: molybdopterin-synthase adenylyltransferase MoeB [Burkholderiales bacterium]|nr:molybdopterin-synthase adenylyltransferase MoeB [Burkholderiales bacterium]
MEDDSLLRYSRHILLPRIGIEGQNRIAGSSALVIGAGGLGCPASLYLASAGVGKITLCDDDVVDLTNLQRQILHTTQSVGMPKVDSAKIALEAVNPEISILPVRARASGALLRELVEKADLVIDASDNFSTRHEVNRICHEFARPLVSGAAIRFDGQISVFDFRDPASPCYHCLYPMEAVDEEIRCAVMGVFSPLVGMIGSMQAMEALKILGGFGKSLAGRLLVVDGEGMHCREIRLKKDPSCPVCGSPPS